MANLRELNFVQNFVQSHSLLNKDIKESFYYTETSYLTCY